MRQRAGRHWKVVTAGAWSAGVAVGMLIDQDMAIVAIVAAALAAGAFVSIR